MKATEKANEELKMKEETKKTKKKDQSYRRNRFT